MSKALYIGSGLLAAAAAVAAGWYYYQYSYTAATYDPESSGSGADDFVGSAEAAVTAAIVGWKNVGSASSWLSTLAQTEIDNGLPTDLLARIAYEESHFREDIIRGTKVSPAGALGIMQLEPAYFHSVAAPVPFSDADVVAQIQEAGQEISRLYDVEKDWSLTLAAYNAGQGEVRKYGGIPPFPETQKYISDITADVPGLS